MILHVRASLLALATVGRCGLSANAPWASSSSSQLSTVCRDVAEANQELDEFFGVSNNSHGSTTVSSSSCHINEGDDLSPERHIRSHGGPTARSAGVAGSEAPVPGWDVAASYGFAGSAEQAAYASRVQPLPSPQQPLPPQQSLPQSPQPPPVLTHIDSSGAASMVDVSQKAVTVREAQASCVVSLGPTAYELVAANAVSKGDVLKVAQLAGVCGAKATASLIPLCHNIPISKVDVQLHLDPSSRSVVVRALARTDGKTGVEMEALTAAAVAALTVYDMCKAAAKDMMVGSLQLDYKSGGRSGMYLRAGLGRADLLPSARPPL